MSNELLLERAGKNFSHASERRNMSTSMENKISQLEAMLKAENETRNKDKELGTVISSPRHRSSTRPQQLGDIKKDGGTSTRSRKPMDLPVSGFIQQRNKVDGEFESKLQEIMKMNAILSINGEKYHTDIKDMKELGQLGNGTCGHVVKMLHIPSNTIIAVKQMRRSGNSEENKRIIMDIDVVLKSHDCPFIVQCLGCFITDSDVWICMELMATCFDKLLKRLGKPVPERILGKVTYATVKALHYLKEEHGVIHRDVKPSNILLDEKGNVKLCDFGISGRLVDSKAKTRSAGCAAYMAPERIDPPDPSKPDYDIRADVWSLGITLVELATGTFPYEDCKTDFEVLTKVLQDEPPSLPEDKGFTPEFRSFVSWCLKKDCKERPKYKKLLDLPFLKRYKTAHVDVAAWYAEAVQECDNNLSCNSPERRLWCSPSSKRHLLNHHRSHSETTRQTDDKDIHGRFSSSFQKFPTPDPSVRLANNVQNNFHQGSPPNGQQRTWRSPIPAADADWDTNRVVGSGFLGSPVPGRKRFPSELPQHINSSSPLVLQRFYHQQNQIHQNHYHHHLHSYPVSYQSSISSQPSVHHSYAGEGSSENTKTSEDSNGGIIKKRFASYLKCYLGGGDSRRNTPPRSSRHMSPGSPHRYSSQSPEPPPRLSRVSVTPSDGNSPQPGSSPLVLRRGILDVSPIRRGFVEGSPSLSRRYISPSPPQPPPRRLSESTSVPGSPQHSRVEHLRARFQYTPEPQRRLFETTNIQDL